MKFKKGDKVRLLGTKTGSGMTNWEEVVRTFKVNKGDIRNIGSALDINVINLEGISNNNYIPNFHERDLELVSTPSTEFKVGDRVKVINNDIIGGGYCNIDIGIIYRIEKNEIFLRDGEDNSEHYACPFNSKNLELIDTKSTKDTPYGISVDYGIDKTNEVKQMSELKKPETTLEKNACKKAKEDAVKEAIELKAIEYKQNVEDWANQERLAKRYRKQANELAEKLGLTTQEKKELL